MYLFLVSVFDNESCHIPLKYRHPIEKEWPHTLIAKPSENAWTWSSLSKLRTHLFRQSLGSPSMQIFCAGAMDLRLRYKLWKYRFRVVQLFRGNWWTTRMTMCGLGYYAYVAKLSIYCWFLIPKSLDKYQCPELNYKHKLEGPWADLLLVEKSKDPCPAY